MIRKHRFRWGLATTLLILLIGISCNVVPLQYQESKPIETLDIEDEINILFIGNSHTFYNDLPVVFEDLAHNGGHKVNAAVMAEGGWSLLQHAQSNITIEQINQHPWDYVVLQEKSSLPVNPIDRRDSMYPAVRTLNQEVENIGGEVILFMTWGRRDGLPEIALNNYDEMQSELEIGYMRIADELDLMVSPVGKAWAQALDYYPDIQLWQTDGSHPSRVGSYLAACVFYAVVFMESPEGLTYFSGIEPELGGSIQMIAAKTVFEDPVQWQIK